MATTASDPIVILSYARTPMGSFQGALSPLSATELGATAVKAAVERAGISGEQVDKRTIVVKQPIKTLGSHEVSIKLHDDVSAVVALNVIPA